MLFESIEQYIYNNGQTTGCKTIANSEIPIEFSMSLDRVLVLRTNCIKLYEKTIKIMKQILLHDNKSGNWKWWFLIDIWTPT